MLGISCCLILYRNVLLNHNHLTIENTDRVPFPLPKQYFVKVVYNHENELNPSQLKRGQATRVTD